MTAPTPRFLTLPREFVLALAHGHMTQTRQLLVPPRPSKKRRPEEAPACPFGNPGDQLLVRETWRYKETGRADGGEIHYEADKAILSVADLQVRSRWDWGDEEAPEAPRASSDWCPRQQLPFWACRFVLDIASVRATTLRDISEEDAIAEGSWEPALSRITGGVLHEADVIGRVWNHLHRKTPELCWHGNPPVWVISFRLSHRSLRPSLAAKT